jgi:hypothetical protein
LKQHFAAFVFDRGAASLPLHGLKGIGICWTKLSMDLQAFVSANSLGGGSCTTRPMSFLDTAILATVKFYR